MCITFGINFDSTKMFCYLDYNKTQEIKHTHTQKTKESILHIFAYACKYIDASVLLAYTPSGIGEVRTYGEISSHVKSRIQLQETTVCVLYREIDFLLHYFCRALVLKKLRPTSHSKIDDLTTEMFSNNVFL